MPRLLLAAVTTGFGCSVTKTWDDEPVQVLSADEKAICFVTARGREYCPLVEHAKPLLGVDVGSCATIDSDRNTLVVSDAQQADCGEIGFNAREKTDLDEFEEKKADLMERMGAL